MEPVTRDLCYQRGEASGRAFARYLRAVLGPREVGGRYRSGYFNEEYTVLKIKIDYIQEKWSITVATDDELRRGKRREHMTPWDHSRDRIVRNAAANEDYRRAHAAECVDFWRAYVKGMTEADETPTAEDFADMMLQMHGVDIRRVN